MSAIMFAPGIALMKREESRHAFTLKVPFEDGPNFHPAVRVPMVLALLLRGELPDPPCHTFLEARLYAT